jgi:Protein of unknown function (DUF2892)
MKHLPLAVVALAASITFAGSALAEDELAGAVPRVDVASLVPLPLLALDERPIGEPPPAPPAEQADTTVFGLPQNVGPVDRVLRAIVAAGLITTASVGLATEEVDPGVSGILYGVSAVPALTAATGYCPLYHALGIDQSF